MPNERFITYTYTLLRQPVPGNREIRFRPARAAGTSRPREAKIHV